MQFYITELTFRLHGENITQKAKPFIAGQYYSFWKKERTRSVCTEKSWVSTKSCIAFREEKDVSVCLQLYTNSR